MNQRLDVVAGTVDVVWDKCLLKVRVGMLMRGDRVLVQQSGIGDDWWRGRLAG